MANTRKYTPEEARKRQNERSRKYYYDNKEAINKYRKAKLKPVKKIKKPVKKIKKPVKKIKKPLTMPLFGTDF